MAAYLKRPLYWSREATNILNTAICSTNKVETARLHKMLRRHFNMLCADVHIALFQDGISLLQTIHTEEYAFLFIDATLPQMKGLDVAHTLRHMKCEHDIIFLSSSPQFALECYAVHPTDYLLYPVQEERLFETLARRKSVLFPAMRYIEVVSSRIRINLFLADIYYIEVLGRTCMIHHCGGNISTNCSLSAIMAQLKGDLFVRVHRSYVVNRFYISKRTATHLCLANGDSIPLSSSKYKEH